ncbi:MAG TPA: type 1 glutamine amidotransferase domain-containing protein [Myxococcales bacterium]|nr:type 1 glutamine amidotransferase domain-containing protein [Myxococcales bacterium]
MSRGRIACLLGEDFEDSEFRIPCDHLSAAGWDVEIVGAEAGAELTGKQRRERVRVQKSIGAAKLEDYRALLIPGGYSPDHLRADARFVDLVRAFDAAAKPIAAVCHGPQLLLTAGLVKGRKLTAWPTVQGDLRQAGAEVSDEPVVVDRNWITSRKPADLDAFSRAFLGALGPPPA